MTCRTESLRPSSWYHRIWCSSIALVLLCLVAESYSQASKAAPAKQTPLKVGFIMCGPANDWGWNYAHNQGRLFLEKNMPSQVVTTFAENIPENAEAERVIEKMIGQGNKLIFLTAFGYLEPALRAAARHPDTIFMQSQRFGGIKNMGAYTVTYYEPMYIIGVVAGHMTKTNKLGFVAGRPIPPLLQTINAFALGARSVNPRVKVRVVWTNSWSDPPTEAEATKALIDSGADVLASNIDTSLVVAKNAESRNIFSVGTHADVHQHVPKGWLTGECKNWGPLYVHIAKSVKNHTWKASSALYGMKDGYTKLASFGSVVPKPIQQEALILEQRLKQGKLNIFKGPLKDREGRERLKLGQTPDIKWLANMDWFVAGVEGSLPKK